MIRLLIVLALALFVSPTVDAKPGKRQDGAKQSHGSHHERTAEDVPPGLAKQDKIPKGLEKKGKTPGGWFKGKAWWKKKPEQPAE